ncbi:hypothetical protein LA345_36430 (plasmid) [Burkholderia vietnamiensis]|nr:hypothetical protein [Burkholderia vietnamiensis]
MTLTARDCAARAAAYERCAEHLEGCVAVDDHEAHANAWLARQLRAEGNVWRELSKAQLMIRGHLDSAGPAVESTPKVGKPLTDRMLETLVELARGTRVESEEFFAWPRWTFQSSINMRTSLGCPTRVMLKGLHERGLLEVRKGKTWLIQINDAGRQALIAHDLVKKSKKASPFKRYSISYSITQLGSMRTAAQPVTARTEKEAFAKLTKSLKARNSHYEYTDFKTEWVSANG